MGTDKIGFGTLALGREYRMLSMLLAYDLSIFHPESKLYVFTDKPQSFAEMNNVIPVNHSFGGVRRCFHDKRHVVSEVLEHYDVCIFLDADCRIISKIDFSEITVVKSFLSSPMVENLENHLQKKIVSQVSKPGLNTPSRRIRLFTRFAENLGVKLEGVSHISEGFFVVQKKFGDYIRFLTHWDYASRYFAFRLYESSEGSSMGISAKACDCNVSQLKIPDWLFNDEYSLFKSKNIEQAKIEKQMITLRKAIRLDCKENYKVLRILVYAIRYIKNLVRYIGYNKKHILGVVRD